MDQRRALGIGILGGLLVTIVQVVAGIGSTVGQNQPLKWNGWFTGAVIVGVVTVVLIVWLLIGGRGAAEVPQVKRRRSRHPDQPRDVGEPVAESPFPDAEFEIGGIGFDTRAKDVGGLSVTYIARFFKNVRITNHESEHRVSLTFHCRKPMKAPDGEIDKWPLLPLTTMPFDVEPKTSKKTDIEFEDIMSSRLGFTEAGQLELDVEDHLSGKRTPLPAMGTWRPAKDGDWAGAFPAP